MNPRPLAQFDCQLSTAWTKGQLADCFQNRWFAENVSDAHINKGENVCKLWTLFIGVLPCTSDGVSDQFLHFTLIYAAVTALLSFYCVSLPGTGWFPSVLKGQEKTSGRTWPQEVAEQTTKEQPVSSHSCSSCSLQFKSLYERSNVNILFFITIIESVTESAQWPQIQANEAWSWYWSRSSKVFFMSSVQTFWSSASYLCRLTEFSGDDPV